MHNYQCILKQLNISNDQLIYQMRGNFQTEKMDVRKGMGKKIMYLSNAFIIWWLFIKKWGMDPLQQSWCQIS